MSGALRHSQIGTFRGLILMLRGRAGVTQREVAESAGVSLRAVQAWEAGVSYPGAASLQRLIALLVEHGAFAAGDELEEAQALWEAALWEAPRLKSAFDRAWFDRLMAARAVAEPRSPAPAPPPAVQVAGQPNWAERGLLAPLPLPLSSLVGRSDDLAMLTELVARPEVRLVTITGPGGVGKTRLAIEAARIVARELALPVAFVPLTGLRDAEHVLPRLAQSLGLVSDDPSLVQNRLIVSLAGRQQLVVLDTLEHLLAAGPAIASLLEHCPGLKVLVTSRAPLHVRGEHLVALAPLALPAEAQTPPSIDLLEQVPAVALFVQRTKEHTHGFAVTEENAEVVTGIVRRLDGLPLALELAATRMRLLSPAALLARLERRMPLLTGGPSDAPAHQRTLRTTIGWSYDLLEPEHRQLLRLLAVFPVGCPLDLLLDVATSDAGGGADPDSGGKEVVILDQLAALVAQSLLIHEDGEDGLHRFRMLDTIREFAGEEALACDEIEANRCRLAHAVVRLAAEAYWGMEGPELMSWLSRLDRELETIRAVMAWTADGGDAALGADLAYHLWGSWLGRSLSREALSWLDRLIPRLDAERAPIGRIRALFVAGAMATRIGEGESRRAYLEESRSLAEAHGALRELGSVLGFLAINGGGRPLAREATAVGRRTGDLSVLAPKLCTEAIIIARLADQEAELLAEECREIWQAAGNARGLADLDYFRATFVDVPRGDFEGSRERLKRALETYHSLGHRERWCSTLVQLARITVTEGDVDAAAGLYSEGLVAAQHLGDMRTIGWCLDGKAWVALHRGRMETAVRLAGATVTWRTMFGNSYPVLVPAFGVAEEALARAALSTEAFAAAWSAGQAMPIDAAIGAALSGGEPVPSA